MNIKEAKKAIEEMVLIYLKKDDKVSYVIPENKQRPVALIGPAGIGKTEIVKQIAKELHIGFLSYSMTHLTRQSAVGLPMIKEIEFEGMKYKVTEYTMSEIIADIYGRIAAGEREGILFIDEFNCLSESLAPAMLEFLQNKTFAHHKLPDGWVIVAAGNPPEYNKSVKEIDTVTQDRLRVLNVKEDIDVWLEYAEQIGIHSLILTYLRQCPKDFYLFEKNKNGREIVTPRAWEDLSITLKSYESMGFEVTEDIISEVIQCRRIARSFMNSYCLYRTIAVNGEVEEILAGRNLRKHANNFGGRDFNERWAIVTVLVERSLAFADKAEELDEGGRNSYYEEINTVITNCLEFLHLAFDRGPELEIYMNHLVRNKNLAITLLRCDNPTYENLCEKMLFDNPEVRLRKEVRKAM